MIRIQISNVGIDRWPDHNTYTKNVDTTQYSESSYADIDKIDKNKYKSVSKLDFTSNRKLERINPYKYSCYANNKAFDTYLKQFYKDIDNNLTDIYIFQEFCDRYIDLFKFKSFAKQLYDLPSILKDLDNGSRKAFVVGSVNNDMVVGPFLEGDNLQIAVLTYEKRKIYIINFHNRFNNEVGKLRQSISNALTKIRGMRNVLFIDDFNLDIR